MSQEQIQDLFIGQRFGKEGQIEVIRLLPSKRGGRDKMVLVKCHVCQEDEELFGSAEYSVVKGGLLKGQIPCGCSARVCWKVPQYEVMVRRKCVDKKYKFLGFMDWKGKQTKITLECEKHNFVWNTTSIDGLLNNHGCPECKKDSLSKKLSSPDEVMSASFLKTGSFKDGTYFTRIKGKKWKYYCPVCSNDEYVQSGVCSGEFLIDSSHAQEGCLSCRCSSRYSWTQKQREYQINKMISTNNDVVFKGWVESHKNNSSRIKLECLQHGEWDVSIESLIRLGVHCPKCGHAKIGDKLRIPQQTREQQIRDIISNEGLSPGCANSGFDRSMPAHLYILKIKSIEEGFTGYGISGDYLKRFVTHKRNLCSSGFSIEDYTAIPCSGAAAQDIEADIRKTFPTHSQDVAGFIREATFLRLYQDVIDFANFSLANYCEDNRPRKIKAERKELGVKRKTVTGVVGVSCSWKPASNGTINLYYDACIGTGKSRIRKSFNRTKLGDEEAFRLACEYRAKMIAELNGQGAGYTERHGT